MIVTALTIFYVVLLIGNINLNLHYFCEFGVMS